MRSGLSARVFLLACLLSIVLPSQSDAASSFSRSEIDRLRSGRLVTRPLPKRQRLVGGNAWIVVDTPWQDVWHALSDPRGYPRMWSDLERVRVLSRRGNQSIVRVYQRATLAELMYTVRLDFHSERREIDFRINDPRRDSVRDGWGFFRLEPHGAGRTLVAYGAAVDPGGIVRTLFADRVRRRILGLPTGVKRYVERRAQAARGRPGHES